jgi:DNA-binding NarL/FixJ family response regulator
MASQPASTQKATIAVVDDQHLFRQGLVSLINEVEEFVLVIEAETGRELLDKLKSAKTIPDVLLMDMKLPDTNGADLNLVLQKEFPSLKVIVLSMYDQERFIYRMIEAGACGYLAKNCDKAELVTAITATITSGFYFNTSTMKAMRNAGLYKKQSLRNINNIPIELTEREEEILRLICAEYTNAEIALQLFLSIRTVDGHRNNLLAKTGCKNTAGLVVFAIRYGIFEIRV